MKKIALFILVIATMNCCKKAKNDYSTMKVSLTHKWELRESIGGFVGRMVLQPGNGSMLEFKGDNSFAYYNKLSTYDYGTYDLQSTSEKDQYTIIFSSQRPQILEKLWNAAVKGDSL